MENSKETALMAAKAAVLSLFTEINLLQVEDSQRKDYVEGITVPTKLTTAQENILGGAVHTKISNFAFQCVQESTANTQLQIYTRLSNKLSAEALREVQIALGIEVKMSFNN